MIIQCFTKEFFSEAAFFSTTGRLEYETFSPNVSQLAEKFIYGAQLSKSPPPPRK